MPPKKKTDEGQKAAKPVKKAIEPKKKIKKEVSTRAAAEIANNILMFDTATPMKHENPESLSEHLADSSDRGMTDVATLFQALMVIRDVEPEHYPTGTLAVALQKAPAVLTQMSDDITQLADGLKAGSDKKFMEHQAQRIKGPELQALFLELASVLKVKNVSFGGEGAAPAAL